MDSRDVDSRELSGHVSEALRRRLQHDRLSDFLDEAAVEAGSVPEEMVEDAARQWFRPA